MQLLNALCETKYDNLEKIVDNDINYIFYCNDGEDKIEKILSKTYFDECLAILNEQLFGRNANISKIPNVNAEKEEANEEV